MDTLLAAPTPRGEAVAKSNLSVTAAAERLGVSAAFLNKLRTTGGGPAFIKLGARIVYSVADLDDWQNANRRRSTSDDRRA
jgi:hypothetical protein